MSTNRYIRQEQLPGFGAQAQQKLAAARVLVVGAGGLGVPALQYLAGMGIGTIGIVDGDTVNLTNLHRQVLYSEADIDKNKATTAAGKLQLLNSTTRYNVYETMLHTDNALSIINQYDVVIDATDNFETRYLINDACVITGKPFVYAAIQGWEAQLSVFNYHDGPTYRCLYSMPPSANEIPNCNQAGVLGVVPGIMGCKQALEAVKIITGMGTSLSGCVKLVDFENDTDYTMQLTLNPINKLVTTLAGTQVKCEQNYQTILPAELKVLLSANKLLLLYDVREPAEFAVFHLPGSINIPLSQLKDNNVPANTTVVTICQSGKRSRQAAMMLAEKLNNNVIYNLAGGIDHWNNH